MRVTRGLSLSHPQTRGPVGPVTKCDVIWPPANNCWPDLRCLHELDANPPTDHRTLSARLNHQSSLFLRGITAGTWDLAPLLANGRYL